MMIEVPNRHEKKTAFHTAYIYTQRAPRRPCLAASHPGLAVPASHTRTLSPTTHMAGSPNDHPKLATLDEVSGAGVSPDAVRICTSLDFRLVKDVKSCRLSPNSLTSCLARSMRCLLVFNKCV